MDSDLCSSLVYLRNLAQAAHLGPATGTSVHDSITETEHKISASSFRILKLRPAVRAHQRWQSPASQDTAIKGSTHFTVGQGLERLKEDSVT